jgi:hypothetical protein
MNYAEYKEHQGKDGGCDCVQCYRYRSAFREELEQLEDEQD